MNIFFTGKLKKLFLLYIRGSASQAAQDLWVIEKVFRKKRSGYFVELGASDGIMASNTLLLETRYGWRGICIEPEQSTFNRLVRNRNCICINACVGSYEGQVEFVTQGHLGHVVGYGSTWLEIHKPKVQPKSVSIIPLEKILADNNAPQVIDYLSLDVEGYEDEVLLNFPFDKYRFSCMTIETPSARLRERLENEGYLVVNQVPDFDTFFIHRDLRRTYHDNIMLENWNWYLFKINAFLDRLGKLNNQS